MVHATAAPVSEPQERVVATKCSWSNHKIQGNWQPDFTCITSLLAMIGQANTFWLDIQQIEWHVPVPRWWAMEWRRAWSAGTLARASVCCCELFLGSCPNACDMCAGFHAWGFHKVQVCNIEQALENGATRPMQTTYKVRTIQSRETTCVLLQ